jgi:hypothetical protein
MKLIQTFSISLVSAGLLFLGACANSSKEASSVETTPIANAPPVESPTMASPTTADSSKESSEGKGGQVVEVGAYHLELVPEVEADAVHLDLYLQKGDNHEAIADAKVTAQVQLPDGTQKTVDFTYADDEKHYTAKLPGSAAGEYKVAVLSEISGEKVNGRFTFSK